MNKAIIVDLDGTLANCDHRRHHVDKSQEKQNWEAFYDAMGNDTVNEWCRNIIYNFSQKNDILIVSGRPTEYLSLTYNWLAWNAIDYNGIWLREDGDYRDDTVVKQEIYDNYIKDKYEILFVLDDRKKVVDMWRRNGLICLHCAEGDF